MSFSWTSPDQYGPKELLIGSTGSGKTHALRTLIDAGQIVLGIFTEPGMEVVGDIPCDKGMHFAYVQPAAMSWKEMEEAAKLINTMSNDGLQKLGGINKEKYRQWFDVLAKMNNFVCDRCKKSFGDVAELGPNHTVFNDSLSGLCLMSSNLVTGAKPIKTQPDWGVMMDNVERYIQLFCTGIKTMAVMTAHIEREVDEVSGGTQIMAGSLGRKLSPKLPRFFSDVIIAKRDGTKFTWSTAQPNTDLKARNLIIGENILPTFKPIVEKWHKRIGFTSTGSVGAPPSETSSSPSLAKST